MSTSAYNCNNFYTPLREELALHINDSKTKDMNSANISVEAEARAVLNQSNDLRNPSNNAMLMKPLNQQNGSRSRSPSPTRPLINIPSHAPLANLETDEEADDREVVNRPYPGVDDGFFTNGDSGGINHRGPSAPPNDSGNPDVEFVPRGDKEPEERDREFPRLPGIGPRAGGDDDDDAAGTIPVDTNPSQPPTEPPKAPPSNPDFSFPGSPGFRPWGYDLEAGSTLPSGETIPDLNVYQHKKTLAQGMMDLALFSANANQLRYVLETFRNHPYYYPSLILISISLILQVVVGVGLVWNATYNVRDKKALCRANKINNSTIIGVFLVTVINVFISAFGVAPAPP